MTNARQLKFRVWDLEWKRFLDDAEFCLYRNNVVNVDTTVGDGWCIKEIESNSIGSGEYPNENCVVQQFTGVKDIHGREIYEGDIVRTVEDGLYILTNAPKYTRGVVTWLREAFCICQESVGGNEMSNYVHCHCCPSDLEIIGNIFENGE